MSDPSVVIRRSRTAYKVRAYPDPEQAALLRRTFGCVRVVWNKTLAARQRRYTTEQHGTPYRETDAALAEWKRTDELAFLSEVSSVPLQQALRHQHTAFQSFFNKIGPKYPRFKSRRARQSAHYTRSAFRIKPDGLWLAKTTAPLRVAWSWPDVDLATLDPTMVIVSREPDGRWYVTFAVDTTDPAPLPETDASVGVDLGLTDFAVLSTGETIANPRHLAKRERNLARYQRRMARCQKGSSNRGKQRRKVARKHAKVRAARRDFLHQSCTDLVRRFDRIGVEDLNVPACSATGRWPRRSPTSGGASFDRCSTTRPSAPAKFVVIDRTESRARGSAASCSPATRQHHRTRPPPAPWGTTRTSAPRDRRRRAAHEGLWGRRAPTPRTLVAWRVNRNFRM